MTTEDRAKRIISRYVRQIISRRNLTMSNYRDEHEESEVSE